jgi:hypothetical protein
MVPASDEALARLARRFALELIVAIRLDRERRHARAQRPRPGGAPPQRRAGAAAGRTRRAYYQSFPDLGTAGVLARELAERLAPSAGLRNRIAHEYDDLDPARVHAALQDAVQDVPAYMAAVLALLDRQPV